MARQGAHEINDIVVGAPVRPAIAVLLHRQSGVIAALPVNYQLQRIANDIDDDLRNDGADDLLARLRRGSRAIPGYGQVSPKSHETFPVDAGESLLRSGVELINFNLKVAHRDKALVPPTLQLSGHKPVVRIDGVILALRASCLVARLAQGELELVSLLRALLAAGVDPRKGRFHADGLKAVEHLLGTPSGRGAPR